MLYSRPERADASPRQQAAKQRRAAKVACGASRTYPSRPRMKSCGAATAGCMQAIPVRFLRSLLRSFRNSVALYPCGYRRTLLSLRVVAPRLHSSRVPSRLHRVRDASPLAYPNGVSQFDRGLLWNPSGYLNHARFLFPACAARRWAMMFNAFGVGPVAYGFNTRS